MNIAKLAAVTMVLTAAVFGFVACSDDDSTDLSPEEAQATLCSELDEFRASLRGLAEIGPESTVDEFTTARTAAESAWISVEEAASELQDARIQDLAEAYESLDATIEDIADEESLSEVVDAIGTDVQAIDDAWDEYYSTAGCS